MKILRSWLEDFVDTSDKTNHDIAEDLESLGHEVESVEEIGVSGLVVGEVLQVDQHPNADRLSVARVSVGSQELTIVCGAPNLAIGQKVPVALIGTKLPGGVIEERSIRGVLSSGMICAEDELGLGSGHEGIMVLEATRRAGEPFNVEADAIFDIAVTSNRGDALSYRGISRDLASRWKRPTKQPRVRLSSLSADAPAIEVRAREAAPRYSARYVRDLGSNQLPEILQKRLQLGGHGHYHPVVGITNYILEETGIPLHAFDAAKVKLPLVIRFAQSGETITLLNDKVYSLEEGDLVIADQRGPIALAGIMGGKGSAVIEQTTEIILEAAYFTPTTIRRTKYRLGILSDAGYRFERGTDPNFIEDASDQASYLVAEYLGGKIGTIEVVGEKQPQKVVPFNSAAINARLGSQLSREEMETILNDLGFVVTDQTAHVPSWRHDVSIDEDLAEEVARVYGYDNLPRESISSNFSQQRPGDDIRYHQTEWLKDQLALAGFTEHLGSSFVSETEVEELKKLDDTDFYQEFIKLKNPVSEEAAYLRPNLSLSLVKALAKNPIFPEVRLFEIGTVFGKEEATALGLIWTGNEYLEKNLQQLLPVSATIQPLAESLKNHFKIRRPAYMYTGLIDFYALMEKAGDKSEQARPEGFRSFRMLSKYQPVMRDVAFLVSKDVHLKDLHDVIQTNDHVVDVELFDQFTSEKLGNQQSLAFHVLLENPDRTLTTEEIQETMAQIEEALKRQFNAHIR